MIDVRVSGPETDSYALVSDDGALHVVQHTHPPIREEVNLLPFRAYFTDSAGSNDLKVNGSTNNVEFCVRASATRDIWVKTISVLIGDSGAKLNQFGNIGVLANGCKLSYISSSGGEIVLHEAIKTNINFLRLGTATPAIGGTSAYKADLSGSGADSYLPLIDMGQQYGMPWGMRLRKNTADKICLTIRDNVTGLDQFDIIAYGSQI